MSQRDQTIRQESMIVIAFIIAVLLALVPQGEVETAYADDPLYYPDDVAAINKIIAANGLQWTMADPADGTYVPADWSGIVWTDDTCNKRISQLDLEGEALTGILDVTRLSELTGLICNGNRLSGLDISGCPGITYLDCSDNLLRELDATGNAELKLLIYSGNPMDKPVLSAKKAL